MRNPKGLGNCVTPKYNRWLGRHNAIEHIVDITGHIDRPGGVNCHAIKSPSRWHGGRTGRTQGQPVYEWGNATGGQIDDRPALGGLLLWQDQENYLRLTWGEYGATTITLVGCIDNTDQILGRGRLLHTGQVHLRLERVGTQVRALCRADGHGWFCVGEVVFSAADGLAVGVNAIGKIDRTFYPGAYPAGTAICFTNFKNTENPSSPASQSHVGGQTRLKAFSC